MPCAVRRSPSFMTVLPFEILYRCAAAHIRTATNLRTSSDPCVTASNVFVSSFSVPLMSVNDLAYLPMSSTVALPLHPSTVPYRSDVLLRSQDPIFHPHLHNVILRLNLRTCLLHDVNSASYSLPLHPRPSFRPPASIDLSRIPSSQSSPRQGQPRCLLRNRTVFRGLDAGTILGCCEGEKGGT